jgi:hypothetical protein
LIQHDGGGNQAEVHHKHFQAKNQANLTLEETNERSHFKDDVALALLTSISPHMVVMFNKINNLLGLDVIFVNK